MPIIRGDGLVREVSGMPCPDGTFAQRGRIRRDALDLLERERLLAAAYCYRIVPLDEPPGEVLRAGGAVLEASRLVPDGGRLTALAFGICTLGPAIERRMTALFAERRMSLALALDRVGNDLLFALARRLQDRIVAEARKYRLTVAGELRAGDPGLPLETQAVVQRLSGADAIGVSVTPGQVLHPVKSISMVLGVGVDLPLAHWSRCDDCPSARKCTMSGRAAGDDLNGAS